MTTRAGNVVEASTKDEPTGEDGEVSVAEDLTIGNGSKSGGRPGMSPNWLRGAHQGPRSQASPAAVLLAQKDFWW